MFQPTLIVILLTKLIIKQLWIERCDWDTKLYDKQVEEWRQVNENLKAIPLHHLPRYIGITMERNHDCHVIFEN